MPNTKSFLTLLISLLAFGLLFQAASAENIKSNTSSSTVTLAAPIIIEGREAEEIWINTGQGRFRFTAEIADEEAERSQGLMFREEMAPTHGMLFVFGPPREIHMWMRNTPLSLDMIFIDETGEVKNIAERTTPFSDAIIDSGVPVSFVLEINAGVSRLLGLKQGDKIEHRLFIKQ